jgi:hypothetical protein
MHADIHFPASLTLQAHLVLESTSSFRLILYWTRVSVFVRPNPGYDGGSHAKSVHIALPPLSEKEREESLSRLRIPSKRQKELQAILDQAWAEHLKHKEASLNSVDSEERRKSAPAA